MLTIDPPTPERAIEILRGIATRYEAHHKVQIGDPACVAVGRPERRLVAQQRQGGPLVVRSERERRGHAEATLSLWKHAMTDEATATVTLTLPQLKHLQKGLISWEALCRSQPMTPENQVIHAEVSELLDDARDELEDDGL